MAAPKSNKKIKQEIPEGQKEALAEAEKASKQVQPAPKTASEPKQIIDLPRGGRRIDN